MRTEASYSSFRYVGFLLDVERHRLARVPALLSSVKQLPTTIAIEQAGPRFTLAWMVC